MTRKALLRIFVASMITVVLAGASLIIARNTGSAVVDAPSGFFH